MDTPSDNIGTQPDERELVFGPFRFIPGQHLLLCGDAPLRLGSRAMAILARLLEQPGELVSKQDLMARVWPKTVVEEGNLKVNVAALRRALMDDGRDGRYIVSVPGRGYRFVAPVTSKNRAAAYLQLPPGWEQRNKLPVASARMVGRDDALAVLLPVMEQSRIVTIVGAGGIGKSTLMLQLAESYVARSGIEVCYVDLAPLAEPGFLIGAVAGVLGLAIHSGAGLPTLLAHLSQRRVLLVLDSCEPLIEAVGALVCSIHSNTRAVQALVTSREPLRIAGEHVHRLPPLAYPDGDRQWTPAQAMAYPAVELFVQRAAQTLQAYVLTEADVFAVVDICRRLEGVALAIELAATRMDAFGARELAARLDDRFLLLKHGRRGSLDRHRTLDAALDWSYELLPSYERKLFCALSVFAGSFSMDAATGLLVESDAQVLPVVDGVANLVHKSLLSADIGGPQVRYRLLDTTKAYARDKLEQDGDIAAMRRRHVQFHQAMFERATGELADCSDAEWLARYRHSLDDVRSALSWAFAPTGDVALGIALTVAAAPLWMLSSRPEECCVSVQRAIAAGAAHGYAAGSDEMKLHAALGTATLYSEGPVQAVAAACSHALRLADERQDIDVQLRALWGLAVFHGLSGEVRMVRQLAGRFTALASGDHSALAAMDRLVGTALHYAGDQQGARHHLERMISQYDDARSSPFARFQLHQRSAALGTLANVLWLQGHPEQSMQALQAALQEARDAAHPESLMHAITNAAFPLALHRGDIDMAESLLHELSSYLASHALTRWERLRNFLGGALLAVHGQASQLTQMYEAVKQMQAAGYRLQTSSHLGMLAASYGAQGRSGPGLALIDEALELCLSGEAHWNHAELLRIKGGLLEDVDAVQAEQLYRQALALAGEQHTPAWELRAATSLADLKARQCQAGDTLQLLGSVYGKFTEGFDTADLRKAHALLDNRH
ncbi:winged helix-turn-helix domain-containing protein [Duganella sp. BuS-21]|uniref:ATP-binding protein n=1 Tax=Duganella sp. BuS-21 TaxID=2943848 RepID=UPI0035A6363F